MKDLLNKIHLMDNMELMAQLPDKSIDLAIVDPPYGIKTWSVTGSKSLSQLEIDKLKSWDKEPKKEYFEKLFKVSKNQIIWGANYFFAFLGKCTTFIVWDKKNRNCNFSDAELAWTSFKAGKVTIFDNYKRIRGNRIHPTQKPVVLYRWLLTNYAKQGDIILDTHCGSASSVIACIEEGYQYIACENDPDYHKDSLKRIQPYLDQGKLF